MADKTEITPKATLRIFDDNLEGIPQEVTVTIALTDAIAKTLIKPCLESIAQTAMALIDVRDGRVIVGVSLGPGLSSLDFDFEETLGYQDGEDLLSIIATYERMLASLKEMYQEQRE